MLYPGYHYLGPGNPIDNGPTVNSTDKIAKKHDISYELAKYPFEVYKSDQLAISEFFKDFKLNHRFADLVGAAGLGIKTAFEKVTNHILYPNM